MGGYIGATAVGLTTTAADVQGDITSTDTTPELILKNTSEEDTEGGREGKITFKGEQSGGEESTLAQIESAHDGTSDDQKGDLIFKTNDGSDGASPTERVRIDSNGSIVTATLGTDNVHLGEGAGASIASGGDNNVAIGKDAGTAITTGDLNVAVGSNALKTISTHSNNTAVGAYALDAGTGNSNVAIGSGALGNASYAADNNIGIGKDVLQSNTTGDSNVAVGHQSLYTNSTAGNNTAVGYQSGFSTSTGDSNTFFGQQAGYATVGNRNTFVGRFAGNESNLAGTQQNTFVGCFAGRYVNSGAKNTIIGAYDGNQGNLDIRTTDGHIVLSDGDGQPIGFITQDEIRIGRDQAFSTTADVGTGIFRSERSSITASANADDFKTSGFYRFDQNASNLPATNTFFAMVIFGNSSNVVTQIAVALQATTSYVRSFNSAWSSWARLDT